MRVFWIDPVVSRKTSKSCILSGYFIKLGSSCSSFLPKTRRIDHRSNQRVVGAPYGTNITIEFMFAGINMFWARLRLILARAAIIITLEGIEEIKTEKNDNKTLRRILFSPAL